MFCAYCGVHYEVEECCLCLPSLDEVTRLALEVTKVNGVWGDAPAEWSIKPVNPAKAFRVPMGEA
jgi:hypothetical protein